MQRGAAGSCCNRGAHALGAHALGLLAGGSFAFGSLRLLALDRVLQADAQATAALGALAFAGFHQSLVTEAHIPDGTI